MTEGELRDVAIALLLLQAALPAIFFAGMLAAGQTVRRAIRRAQQQIRAGGDASIEAADRYVSSQVVLFSLIALVLGLFIVPSAQVSLYVAETPSSVTDFIKLQVGTYVIVWGALSYFLLALVPQMR